MKEISAFLSFFLLIRWTEDIKILENESFDGAHVHEVLPRYCFNNFNNLKLNNLILPVFSRQKE